MDDHTERRPGSRAAASLPLDHPVSSFAAGAVRPRLSTVLDVCRQVKGLLESIAGRGSASAIVGLGATQDELSWPLRPARCGPARIAPLGNPSPHMRRLRPAWSATRGME